MKKCCVIGLGYIGLPTAIILAESGYQVLGIDINKDIIRKVNAGEETFSEPNLVSFLRKVISNKKLIASDKLDFADAFIIAVPTPFIKESGENPKPDISFVIKAAESISGYIKKGNKVLIESTIPVGTTEKVAKVIQSLSGLSTDDFHICHCPERVLPGAIFHELVNNDRIIGGIKETDNIECKKIYESFCKGKIFLTNSKTAEMTKLAENAFRDTNIAFANEISMLSDKFGICANELISLANKHPRVNILKPGCGVGGHCIAVDPWFIVDSCPKESILIKTARVVNNKKTTWVINKIIQESKDFFKKNNRKPIIGCFGITFKPNIDDLRESPALEIVNQLIKSSETVIVCEPNIDNYKNLNFKDLDTTISESDLLVVLVNHKEFILNDLINKKILDFCGSEKI